MPTRTVCGLAAAVVLGAVLVPVTGSAAPSDPVVVDPAVQYQTIEGWGTSLAWWAEGAGGWSDGGQRARLADALFDPGRGLGLNVVRYNIGGYGPGETCTAPFRTGGAVPSFAPEPGVWRPDADPRQLGMARAAADRGADRFDAIAYSAPTWMTRNGCTQGAPPAAGQHTADNLDPAHYRDFAGYVAHVVRQLRGDGLPVGTVDPFNEPSVTPWVGTARQEGMNVDEPARAAVIADLYRRLAAGPTAHAVGISGTDEATAPAAASEVAGYSLTDPDVRADLTRLTAHNYESAATNDDAFGGLGTRDNTPTWMSEWGDGATAGGTAPDQMSSAVQLSQRILKNENQIHPTAWVAWQAVDGPVDGGDITDLWGLVWANITPGAPRAVDCPYDERDPDYPTALCYPKRYWVMGNYSRYVRPGYRMLRSTDGNTFAAYDAGAHRLVLVVTNPNADTASRDLDLSRFASVGPSAQVHRTDGTHNLATMPAVATRGGTLPVTLPPKSVTTYVLPATMRAADAPAEIGARDAAVTYQGAGWRSGVSAHRGDTATVAFTGTRVRLFADRAPGSGRALVSVDGGTPTEIDLYARRPTTDRLVYESPDLPAGRHHLTVRVGGAANPDSTGAAVGFRRAEVDGGRVPTGSYVHAQAVGPERSDFTGSVGMQITTGPHGLPVRGIGRYRHDGDARTHTLRIVRVSDGATVAAATLPAGTAATDALGYQYAELPRPVTLAPDTRYAVLSSEVGGGDAFGDPDGTAVTTAAGASVTGPSYVDSEGVYHAFDGQAGRTYGPVSLRLAHGR